MKTLYTLSTIILIALSLNSSADDRIKNRDKSATVSVAPFIWGDPEIAPADLREIKNAMFPSAPFVWGTPDDALDVLENKNLSIPAAPFIYGNPDEDAPLVLENIKVENSIVPVAPFVWGSPEVIPALTELK